RHARSTLFPYTTLFRSITTYVKECVVSEKFDESRFEQEMIYYIEKLDINEEKVRLGQHCVFFLETLSQEAVGKKLGFIAQEIGRDRKSTRLNSSHVKIS